MLFPRLELKVERGGGGSEPQLSRHRRRTPWYEIDETLGHGFGKQRGFMDSTWGVFGHGVSEHAACARRGTW